jgi:hypothetical protein
MREKKLLEQIVIRVTPELREALEKDARENERTMSQTLRFHLRHLLEES